jgi:hypothetical protein
MLSLVHVRCRFIVGCVVQNTCASQITAEAACSHRIRSSVARRVCTRDGNRDGYHLTYQ